VLAIFFALFAIGNSVREALLFEVLKASIVIRKLAVEIFYRVPQVLWNRLSAVHGFYLQTLCLFFYVMSRDNYRANAFHEKAGLSQVGFCVSLHKVGELQQPASLELMDARLHVWRRGSPLAALQLG